MNCPTCGHPMSAHSDTGGWCLFPGCDCGRHLTFEFYIGVERDGATSWLVHVECPQIEPHHFHFTVTGETENEALFNASRVLKNMRPQA